MSRREVRKRAWNFVSKRSADTWTWVRRKSAAVDHWIQDHVKAVTVSMLLTLGLSTAWLLYFHWDEVIDLAKQIAPVFTIVSIAASAVLAVLKRKSTTVDRWFQGHSKLLAVSMLLTLGLSTAWLLYFHWDEVIDLAKQIAPVFTIVSIAASAVLAVLKWMEGRRAKRLAEQEGDASDVPREPSGG